MIVLTLAAALLMDTTPKQKVAYQPPQPTQAERAWAEGRTLAGVAVTLECTARASGRVENCQVLGESHPGMGFGEAAVALMRDARVAAGPRDVQFARTIQFTP